MSTSGPSSPNAPPSRTNDTPIHDYKLYKRRFVGLLGMCILNLVGGMPMAWFGPIANSTSEAYHITLDRVNWLGNITACVYIPAGILTPWCVSRYGVRRTCEIGSLCFVLAAWIRYAGNAKSLSPDSAYALLIIGQFFSTIPQAIFQVLPTKYSELWFGIKGRTTATMAMSIMNPIGSALAQVISPLLSGPKESVLVLGIIETAAAPFFLLVGDRPPTPPTYAAAHERSQRALLKEFAGLGTNDGVGYGHMSLRERLDFGIMILVFGVQAGAINTFAVLTSQYFSPQGYSDDTSGFIGATLLLAGIVAAAITSPIFDRVFTRHLGLTLRLMVPVLSALWLSLIWAVRPNNTAVLYVLIGLTGVCAITMLPVSLELAAELTRAPDASSAFLWVSSNVFTIMMILVESALRAGPDAKPPLDMRKSLIFHGAIICGVSVLNFGLRGKQTRRERDEKEATRMEDGQDGTVSPKGDDVVVKASEESKEA